MGSIALVGLLTFVAFIGAGLLTALTDALGRDR